MIQYYMQTLTLSKEQRKKLREESFQNKITMSEVVRKLIDNIGK